MGKVGKETKIIMTAANTAPPACAFTCKLQPGILHLCHIADIP